MADRSLLVPLLRRTRFPLIALGLVSLFSNLMMLTGPLFMLQVYDRVLASRSVPTLVALTLLVAGLYAFYALLEWLRARMTARFGAAFEELTAGPVFSAAVRMRTAPGTPDPIRDLDSIRGFVAGPGPLALFDLPWLPVYLAIVFLFHPMLGWLAVGGAVVVIGLLVLNEAMSRKPAETLARALTRRQSFADDTRTNAEAVLAMGMLDDVTARWRRAATEAATTQFGAADSAGFYASATKAFRLLLQSLVLALGALLVIEGQLSAGLMIAASVVTSRALAPIEQVVAHWRSFIGARQAGRRLGALLAAAERPAQTMELPRPHRSLDVRGLVSGPEPRKPLVQGITFSLTAGEALGVLGLSGSGKTSLTRALVGVWPVMSGEARLDGSELQHFNWSRLGPAIGYLPQVVDLFDGTVAQNIGRFSPDATSASVLRAARLAQVHDLVASLPDGYDTQLGPRGAALSAGQRQRIGLARALFGDPFLLVLDEPNSNLDHEGDMALQAALADAKSRGAIIIIVAHRPSAIGVCDKLLYMQDGRQVAFGPKAEVLARISAAPTPLPARRANG
jgi:ATP-binding cassette, subfamily C, bacterial PrsD